MGSHQFRQLYITDRKQSGRPRSRGGSGSRAAGMHKVHHASHSLLPARQWMAAHDSRTTQQYFTELLPAHGLTCAKFIGGDTEVDASA